MGSRLLSLRWVLLLGFGILVLRLVHLQVVHGARYRELAERNRLRVVPEEAPRGLIVDRHGALLASNRTVFRLAVIPQELEQAPDALETASALIHQPVARLEQAFAAQRTVAFMPATVVSHVPKALALRVEEERMYLPGILIKPEAVRDYPGGPSAAHLLGYLGQPTAEQLPLLKQYGVRPKHLIGKMGIEALYDDQLRGRAGGTVVEVNHRTRQVGTVGQRSAEAGQRITLTLDASLQSLVEAAFAGQPGAAVVMDPQTGAVLAMASIPAFTPAAFVSGDAKEVRRLLSDPAAALMNRSTQGTYTPGSIAKLLTAIAMMEAGLQPPSQAVVCGGSLKIGDRVIHCWNREGHGPVTLTDALMVSCNVYFMTVGRRLGVERLKAAQAAAGWGRRTGWPLEEQPGKLPARRLTEGEVAMLALGQGEVLVTPLQVAVMASAFANGGWIVKPWVVSEVAGRAMAPPPRSRIGWAPESLEAVRHGMIAAVAQPSGTAHRAHSPHVTIAAKTGTAQTPVPGKTHGWFAGYCPIEQPRAALAIVAEYGGSGGDLPAEIARTVCEYLTAADRAGAVLAGEGMPRGASEATRTAAAAP